MNLHELVRMVTEQEQRIAVLEESLKTLEARVHPAMPTQPRPQSDTLHLPGKKAGDGI